MRAGRLGGSFGARPENSVQAVSGNSGPGTADHRPGTMTFTKSIAAAILGKINDGDNPLVAGRCVSTSPTPARALFWRSMLSRSSPSSGKLKSDVRLPRVRRPRSLERRSWTASVARPRMRNGSENRRRPRDDQKRNARLALLKQGLMESGFEEFDVEEKETGAYRLNRAVAVWPTQAERCPSPVGCLQASNCSFCRLRIKSQRHHHSSRPLSRTTAGSDR